MDFGAIERSARARPSSEDLKRARKERELLEGPSPKSVRRHAHRITGCALWFGAFLLGSVFLVRFWHLIGPSEINDLTLHWLSKDHLQTIDSMLFSSAFGGVVLVWLKEMMIEGAQDNNNDHQDRNPFD